MMAITHSSLALLVVVSAISSDISTAFSNLRTTPRNLQTYSSYDGYFQQMLDAVNAERAKAGLSALCTNKKLAAAAARHSKDMADNDFMEHDGSDGSTMSERVTAAGYQWTAVAENVAAGQEDVASVMESWMNSEGHRANILGADYSMFGTAYAYNADSTYKHYWTQDFGAGDTEACDSGSSTASQSTDQTQQQNSSQSTDQTQQQTQQEDVAGEASTSQDYTTAPSTTARQRRHRPPLLLLQQPRHQPLRLLLLRPHQLRLLQLRPHQLMLHTPSLLPSRLPVARSGSKQTDRFSV
ncbi:hypothetical protein AM588_10009589 [Phytophthora nicotianae]|uniref:SCP domain-containing protein n=1 Tax=Phytophthora nicotianae TaxID=4792 RepID=A0A0W8D9X5_PHYNI|nr:hypothetical protein AM588_10009589 [Phytophthora nicotianae]